MCVNCLIPDAFVDADKFADAPVVVASADASVLFVCVCSAPVSANISRFDVASV